MNNKICSTCKIEKSVSEFYRRKDRPSGYTSQCKRCIAKSKKKSNIKYSQKRLEYQRKYNIEHKKDKSEYDKRRRKLPKVRYRMLSEQTGIDAEELDSIYNELFSKQEGRCSICGIHQCQLEKRLAIDHNHYTGQIRELLCRECNLGISNFKEDVQILKSSIRYLLKHYKQKKER